MIIANYKIYVAQKTEFRICQSNIAVFEIGKLGMLEVTLSINKHNRMVEI